MAARIRTLVLAAAVFATALVAPARADDAAAMERGKLLATENCARCHALGAADVSPFEPAPPFRVIANRYPVESLAEAFAEGITVGHPAMPEFVFEPNEIGDLLTFLDSFTTK